MKVRNILISQPRPTEIEKSPYYELIKRYGVNIDFHKFFKIEGLTSIDYRRENKVRLSEHTAVIFTSKHGVDNFFRLAIDLRFEVPESMKYFCSSEAIALYLQKYIQYRKRKIFFSNQELSDLVDSIRKHKSEQYLLPCNEDHNSELSELLDAQKITYDKAVMYRTVSEDMSFLDPSKYDLMVFFSPAGIKSLLSNFKDYKQKDQLIGVFGPNTAQGACESGLKVAIEAPNEKAPSMVKAIDHFLSVNHKGK